MNLQRWRIKFSNELRKFVRRIQLAPSLTKFYDRWSPELTLGQRGEREAERFLLRQGWITIDRQYSDRFGEIDLIVTDGQTVVFVEVKTRSIEDGTSPAEAVDQHKIARFTKTAQRFVRQNALENTRLRFDVIAILWPENEPRPRLRHFAAAFEPAGEFQLF